MIALKFDLQIQDSRHLENGSFQTFGPIAQNTWKYISHKMVVRHQAII